MRKNAASATEPTVNINDNAVFLQDIVLPQMQYAAVVRSEYAKAEIREICLPKLPQGYRKIDYDTLPGNKKVMIDGEERPIFAKKEVSYIGEPILMIVGPDIGTAREIALQTKVLYEVLAPALTMADGTVIVNEVIEGGSPEKILTASEHTKEEHFVTECQCRVSPEVYGAVAKFDSESTNLLLYQDTDVSDGLKEVLLQAIDIPDATVSIIHTGSTYACQEGVREEPLTCCHAMIAAFSIGCPVALILSRDESLIILEKRHPMEINIKSAYDESGLILAIEVDLQFDCGLYLGNSRPIARQTARMFTELYPVDHYRIRSRLIRTNKAPNGVCRGYDRPQAIFSVEMYLVHFAKMLGIEPLAYRRRYLTPYRRVLQMVDMIEELSRYTDKHRNYGFESGGVRHGIGIAIREACTCVVEVEVEFATGMSSIVGITCILDPDLCRAEKEVTDIAVSLQNEAEQGIITGVGFAKTEQFVLPRSITWQTSQPRYLLPSDLDLPKMQIILLEHSPDNNQHPSLCAFDHTMSCFIPAYCAAIEQAFGVEVFCLPMTEEDIIRQIEK